MKKRVGKDSPAQTLAHSLNSFLEYALPCEVSMRFTIRPFRRFPVQCRVTETGKY